MSNLTKPMRLILIVVPEGSDIPALTVPAHSRFTAHITETSTKTLQHDATALGKSAYAEIVNQH